VADTTLTVPGIHYVIDPGFARISRYSHRSKVQRLPVEPVSQASANQRKGRCGRVADGICIRLYSEEDFLSRRDFTEPEIQRTNLASVILQMKILGFGEIETFPFINPPDKRLIKDGYRVLEEIGAIGGDRRVTRMGRQLARLPVDPRIGRMLMEAAHTHCLEEVLVIAAALSIQDPRERPLEKQQAADEAHQFFRDEESDFISHLKLWRFLMEQRRHLSRRKFQRLCRDSYLSWMRVQEWQDIHHQLRGQMHEMGYRENRAEAGYEEIHKAVLIGLLSNIGFRASGRDREYQGARGSRFMVFPGSGLFRKQPKWVMAAELVETSRLYARTVATIKPEWIEKAAGHLVKKGYSEPHWERDRGQVAAYVRINLFGLTLIPRRKVNYGPIDPEVSREIFIRSALVDGDFKTRAPFWRHNRELIEYVEYLEHKSRRRDLLVDEEVIYEYYDRRIPEGIYSTPQFDQWLRGETRTHPKLLHMRLDDLIRERLEAVSDSQFPDRMDVNGTPLPLDYRFEPGHGADGVTLKIPLPMLNQVSAARCDWLVPGLLRERIVALLRSLPKQLRRAFVPIPEVADSCLRSMQPSDTPLIRALGERLKEMTGVHVPEDAWQEALLPDYLKMHYLVVDEKGRRLDASRDLVSLQKRFGGLGDGGYRKHTDTGFDREGITRWDFGQLPESIEIRRGGIDLKGYPALVDKKDSVALRVLDSKENARRAHRAGLRRLFMLAMSKDIRYLRRNFTGLEPMRLQYSKAAAAPAGLADETGPDLENQLVVLILDLTFIEGMAPVRDAGAFEQRIRERKGRLMDQATEAVGLVRDVLNGYQEVRKLLSGITQANWKESVSDITQQMDRLVYQGFIGHTPYPQLQHVPRYLKALRMRLEKLGHAASRDRQLTQELYPLYSRWQEWDGKCRNAGRVDERIEELRWRFEELRVSLFAQELGTAYPVSIRRIEKRWKELGL
jgi:ATP-dependent helicase HrpA